MKIVLSPLKNISKILIALLVTTVVLSSCRKETDDPGTEIPTVDIESNTTIAAVKKLYTDAGSPALDTINDDLIIKGTVISSDSTGNHYKVIYIQDESAGIPVKLNKVGLYQDYPIGTELYIKLNGMNMGSYGGLIQLGGIYNDAFGNLDEALITNYLVKGEAGSQVNPYSIDLANIPSDIDSKYGSWVQIDNVMFTDADKDKTYANAVDKYTENRTLTDANGNTIIVRTSGYATFAGTQLPTGSGTAKGVLTVYNGTLQLIINSTDDLSLDGARFNDPNGGGSGGTGTTPTLVDSVDETFDGTKYDAIDITGWNNIVEEGSKAWFLNEYNSNTYANMSVYTAGEKRKVWLITPILNVTSATDKTISFTTREEYRPSGGATFKVMVSSDYDASALPSDSKFTWTELSPTISNDGTTSYGTWTPSGSVDLSSYGNVVVAFFYEGEDGVTDGGYSIDDFKFNTTSGGGGSSSVLGAGNPILGSEMISTTIDFNTWNEIESEAIWSASNSAAYVNAYGLTDTKSWLISQSQIDFSSVSNAVLKVVEKVNYFTTFDDVMVMYSTDYSGSGDPTSATWTQLTYDNSVNGDRTAGAHQTSLFGGITTSAYVAFKYSGLTSAGNVCSWEIQTVQLVDKTTVTPDGGTSSSIVNGDFEGTWLSDNLPDGWEKAENITKESSIVHSGSFSAKHSADGTKDLAQIITAEAGATYEISFWYYVESTGSDGTDGRLWSFFEQSDGTDTGEIKDPNDYLNGTVGQWNQYSAEYTAPANTTQINFELRAYGSAVVYWDDITITKK